MNPTDPQMPMAVSAARLSLDDQSLPDLNLSPRGGRAPLSLEGPSQSPFPMGMPPGTSALPAPPAPASPPWNVELQGDGSSIYTTPGPDGKPLVLGVNPAPKLPKAHQPAKSAAQ